jgi:hypothetical protein
MRNNYNPSLTSTEGDRPAFHSQAPGKKVTIRLVSGSQPITGIVDGYNPYEILAQTTKGQILVFKSTPLLQLSLWWTAQRRVSS